MYQTFLGYPPSDIKKWIKEHPPVFATTFVLVGGDEEKYTIKGALDTTWMEENGFVSNGTWVKQVSSVDIGNSVTSIGESTFLDCVHLETVTIGRGVTNIGSNAFFECASVRDVYCSADPSKLTWNESNCDDFKDGKATILHVAAEHLDAYVQKFGSSVNVSFVGDLKYAQKAAVEIGADGQYDYPVEEIGLPAGTYSMKYVGQNGAALDGFGDIKREVVVS